MTTKETLPSILSLEEKINQIIKEYLNEANNLELKKAGWEDATLDLILQTNF